MDRKERIIYATLTNFSLIFGLLGNFVCILVFSRKKFNEIPSSFFFKALAFNDMIILLHEIRHFVRTVFQINLKLISEVNCKMFKYILISTVPISSWIMVYIVFDRFITIKFYKRFLFRNSLKFKILILGLIYLSSFSFNIPHAIFNKILKNDGNKNKTDSSLICDLYENQDMLYMMSLFYSAIIPFIIIFIFTLALSFVIFKSRKRLYSKMSRANKNMFKKDIRLSITSIVLNTIFILTNFPFWFEEFFNIDPFLYDILDNLVYTNCAIQVFIHIITNKIFRKEFQSILSLNLSNDLVLTKQEVTTKSTFNNLSQV